MRAAPASSLNSSPRRWPWRASPRSSVSAWRLWRPIPLSQANEANELAWDSWFLVLARRVGIGVAVAGVLGFAFAYLLSEGTLELTPGARASGALYMVGMIGVCTTACIVPTRKALAIHPTEALAAEG